MADKLEDSRVLFIPGFEMLCIEFISESEMIGILGNFQSNFSNFANLP